MIQLKSSIVMFSILILFSAILIFTSCDKAPKAPEEMPEFHEAFANVNNFVKNEGIYDIEETIKIMNFLDAALVDSSTLDSFLASFARTDFSKVAPDILKSNLELLEILQEMRKAEYECSIDNATNAFVHGISTVQRLANRTDTKSISLGVMLPTGLASAILSIGKDTVMTAFDEMQRYLKEKKKLNKAFLKRMRELKTSYMQYMTSYTPIYEKYCKEWDTLCLMKDKAYIDINNERFDLSFKTTNDILAKYPENRETLLLNALSLAMLGMNALKDDDVKNAPLICQNLNLDASLPLGDDAVVYFAKTHEVLKKYISLYPSYSAPALALKGMVAICQGQEKEGLAFLDQASVEFPRQASKLTEMFNLYKSRAYLNKSVEGKYLLRLYLSTMEGYGIFSPNLIKAGYYSQNNDEEYSQKEIFNHFFRRGNQDYYDCLLSDVQFCDKYLDRSFKRMLPEHSFMDIIMSKSIKGKKRINLTLNNRSNVNLRNVRIFLCVHLTDMYTDEYEVIKVPSKNIVPAQQKTDLDQVILNYEDKTYNDIAHARAIVMTDDAVFWVDEEKFKYEKTYNAFSKLLNSKKTQKQSKHSPQSSFLDMDDLSKKLTKNTDALLTFKERGITKSLANKLSFKEPSSPDENWNKTGDRFKIQIPRELFLSLDPVFSLKLKNGEMLKPSLCYLNDMSMRLAFDALPEESCTLYVYNKYALLKILFNRNETKMTMEKVVF